MRAAYIAFAGSLIGCSSIPDVQYLDVDAGGSSSGDSSSGNSSSGNDGGWSCPTNPPPPGKGVCCESKLCLRCTQNSCDKCIKQECDGDEVCCGKNLLGLSLDCKRASSCN